MHYDAVTYEALFYAIDANALKFAEITNSSGKKLMSIKAKDGRDLKQKLDGFFDIFGEGTYIIEGRAEATAHMNNRFSYRLDYHPTKNGEQPSKENINASEPLNLAELKAQLLRELQQENELNELRSYKQSQENISGRIYNFLEHIATNWASKRTTVPMQGTTGTTINNVKTDTNMTNLTPEQQRLHDQVQQELTTLNSQLNEVEKNTLFNSSLLLHKHMPVPLIWDLCQILYNNPQYVDVMCNAVGLNRASYGQTQTQPIINPDVDQTKGGIR